MKKNYLQTAVLLFLLALVVYITLPNGIDLPQRDSGVFLYMGQRILAGDIPYKDLWDHKPPLIFFINALGLFLGGGSTWGVWAIGVATLYLAASVGFLLIKKTFGLFPAIIGSLAWLISSIGVFEGGNLTEVYALPCQSLSLYLFYVSENEEEYAWRGFAIGALTALCFFLRQNLIGVGVAISLYILFKRIRQQKWRELLVDFSHILLGAMCIVLLIVGYFKVHGSLGYLWDAAFRFNFFYSQTNIFNGLKTLQTGIKYFRWSYIILATWAAALYFVIFNRKYLNDFQSLIIVTIIGLPIELLLNSISGKLFNHYFITWLPYIMILASFFSYIILKIKLNTAEPKEMAQEPKIGYSIFAKVSLIALLIFLSYPSYKLLKLNYFHATKLKEMRPQFKAMDYVLKYTEDDDYLLVWGSETAVNFLTKRPSPSRFFYQLPLIMKGYSTIEMLNEFLTDVQKKKPEIIIDVKTKNFPPVTKFLSISNDYKLDGNIDNWTYYSLKRKIISQ